MKRVLVTGATGNVGSQVVAELRRRGVPVRAFVRDAAKAALMLGDVELALGDFADEASLRRALEGVESIFLACANVPRQLEYETRVIDVAAAVGVGQLVKLSVYGAEVGAPVAYWDWHGQLERHLAASGVHAVILQPTFYMTNLFMAAEGVKQAGALVAPAAGARIAMTDPRDVAAVAAAVLSGAVHAGRPLVLTGPEVVTYEQVAHLLARATGSTVAFLPVSDEAARQALLEAGTPEFVVAQLIALFGCLRQGVYGRTTDTVRAMTGLEPRSLAQFIQDNAAPFGAEATTPATLTLSEERLGEAQ